MTILIANIGTSDLAVKVEEYYIPIGFDRNEPNLEGAIAELDDGEKQAWEQREKTVNETLTVELGLSSGKRPAFRDLTRRLFEEYKKDANKWHPRISPGRILGAIDEAMKNQASDIYMFVTNHPQFLGESHKLNPGYPTDTVHLFEILKLWCDRQFPGQLSLHHEVIPRTVSAINQDGLLEVYYKFFNQFDKSEKILVSVKGGTPQMQTALRVQAMSSDIVRQIYLEPHLSIKRLLAGQPSLCQRISYWRYQRVQKYQEVKQLLQRWDFDGAATILGRWKNALESLSEWNLEDFTVLRASQKQVYTAYQAAKMAVGFLNLDTEEAGKHSQGVGEDLAKLYQDYQTEENSLYRLLNLYSQCCLFEQVDRFADLLLRMGVFYEEIIHDLIRKLDGKEGYHYFNRDQYPNDWYLRTEVVVNEHPDLAQAFYKLEKDFNSDLYKKIKKYGLLVKGRWEKPLNRYYRFPGRFTKRNFLEALVQVTSNKHKINAFRKMLEAMKCLDYWALKRNQLVHGAKGISLERSDEELKTDLEDNEKPLSEFEDALKGIDPYIKETVKNACKPDNIIANMNKIVSNAFILAGEYFPKSIASREDKRFYLYSYIRQYITDTLRSDVK